MEQENINESELVYSGKHFCFNCLIDEVSLKIINDGREHNLIYFLTIDKNTN